MKKVFTAALLLIMQVVAFAQDDIYPAPEYKGLLFITNGTVHTGAGTVIENATIEVREGKIVRIGKDLPVPQGDVKVFDATGKHVYPGLILPDTDLGLKEISGGVRGTNDYREIGEYNSNIRSIVAYNTDSRLINVLRANGILLANVSPQGGLVLGSSSVVQLDAWNYEDAVYKVDGGMHIQFPSFLPARSWFNPTPTTSVSEAEKNALEKINEVKQFLREAKAYGSGKSATVNLKLEALQPLFQKKQKLFIHANEVKQMLAAVDFAKEFDVELVIVGGADSWLVAPLLKENNVAVILTTAHRLPGTEDEDVDQPYKTPALLHKEGVLFCINDDINNARYRNLAFNAGTAAAYGLTKEQALSAITLNAAKILGIAERTGSLEVGKDANILVSEGDIMDMRTNILTHAFIQGRHIKLENKQTQLNDRFTKKYGIE